MPLGSFTRRPSARKPASCMVKRKTQIWQNKIGHLSTTNKFQPLLQLKVKKNITSFLSTLCQRIPRDSASNQLTPAIAPKAVLNFSIETKDSMTFKVNPFWVSISLGPTFRRDGFHGCDPSCVRSVVWECFYSAAKLHSTVDGYPIQLTTTRDI